MTPSNNIWVTLTSYSLIVQELYYHSWKYEVRREAQRQRVCDIGEGNEETNLFDILHQGWSVRSI
jgi:hypothetical protein